MLDSAVLLAVVVSVSAWQNKDPWFDQWNETDRYLASDGNIVRMPLRLASQEMVLYGGAELEQVLPDFADEDWTPVTVGGKVAMQVWLNNFTDTDCGKADEVNPYFETWFSLPVTHKSAPLDLPYESPLSYVTAAADPRANVFVMRVICGSAFGDPTQPMAAISGGREIWGFPKHYKLADIRYDYDGNYTSFSAEHLGNAVLTARVMLPEATPGHVVQKQDLKTPNDICVTPRWSPKQSRYGEAFSATWAIAPWDPKTDTLTVHGQDEWYGSMLKRWNFEPAMKMHSTDFKVAAFKPAGWLPASAN